MHLHPRRGFLAASAAVAVSAVSTRETATADEQSSSTSPHRSAMKLSLAAYSFNRLFARRGTPEQISAARMNLESFIDFAAEQGLGAAELTGYYFPRDVTHDYLMGLRQRTHRLGITISGTAIGNDFCVPEGPARDRQLAECREWIDYAAAMGAPVIRIFAGKVPTGDTEEAAIARCAAGISESLDYAGQRGIFLALENHGGITSTPAQMLKIMEQVDESPWFGVNFDSGNFRTDDPYQDLARIAPYAVNAQIKATISPGGQSEPADLQRIIRILDDAGYRGFVALEYEEREDPFEAIPRYLQELSELIRGCRA